jgi:hypothetical protein
MNVPQRKIPNTYHNSLISLGLRHKDPKFRDLVANPEALERIRQIREHYDFKTFIDISILVPICATCKQSADREVGESILPQVGFPDWQSNYESIGIDRGIIVMIEEQISKKNWESLFCFSCQTQIYFPKPFSAPRTNNFFIYSISILEFYGCKSSPGKQPPQWMRDILIRIYGEKCFSCNKGLRAEFISHDHIYPRSLGGGINFLNLQILCRECNTKKADTPPKLIISQITAELFPPKVDCKLSESDKRIDISGDNRTHPLAQFFYQMN